MVKSAGWWPILCNMRKVKREDLGFKGLEAVLVAQPLPKGQHTLKLRQQQCPRWNKERETYGKEGS